MIRSSSLAPWATPLLLVACATDLFAQRPPYDVFPPADPPYYRVRYEAGARQGELAYPVNYTIWIPKGVKTLRGVIVHQHGCGEGSCKSGLTGAYDLHWQALARKHDCALLSPAYEQPDKADCQLWCDPRNGSAAAFQRCLVDLGAKSGHPELAKVPLALWGHSGGGHWAGGMVLLYPERVAAAWLRSGVPLLKEDPKRANLKAHKLPDAALHVPLLCNLGTKEGVTDKDKQFAGVWPANEAFFNEVRGKGGLIGVAVDPLSSHECGNQRYLAIPWLDACLSARLPKKAGDALLPMPTDQAWLAPVLGGEGLPAAKYKGDSLKAAWLPNQAIAKAWMEYVKDTKVTDATPPPAPTNVRVQGNRLTWEAEADLESGLAYFIVELDGQFLAQVPEQPKNPFGRPLFQNLQYSDTPPQPLALMQYTDIKAAVGKAHSYRVIAVNTVGAKSAPSTTGVTGNAQAEPKVYRELAYSEPKNKLQMLDIFAPAEGKNHPVVIYVHGGGWHSGDKAEAHNKPTALTDRGFVLASINYRLWTPPWSKDFPGTVTLKHQAQDVGKAIRWVHEHARDYGGDPATLIVMGHSAGAHLSALVCTDERYLKAEGLSLANIKGCVPIDGDSHDLPMHVKANADKKVAATDRERFGAEDLQKELSPVMHVAKGKNIPPFLILHILDRDHPETQAQAERFAQVLREAGVSVSTHGAAGKDHSTLNNGLGLPDDKPTQEMFAFLSQVSRRQ
jgi:acetyl esterase/lipase/pimeloyl-ACP methyl ester carboxylesterase